MKNLLTLVFIGLFPAYVMAQPGGSVQGKLVDSATKQPLPEATVSVLYQKDSSLHSFILSDKNGSFQIKGLNHGNYLLLISHSGFELIGKKFSINNESVNHDFGQLLMSQEYKTLTGVVVSDITPVKIKGDTISFRADAFKTQPDATLEDVLKKLPGVQVQKDGSIRAMGETVQKVYVDGKEFFGNDPKIATKNLTAAMVDQIQVFDDMSEQARFTKIDDGSRTKAINIKLKKDKNKGDFGRVGVGAGSDSRYDGSFSLNHFRGNRRISLVGSANNTNKLSYTFSDYSSAQGNVSQFTNGGGSAGFSNGGMVNASGNNSGGISRPLTAGINYNDQWGSKVDFRASYFYSDNENVLIQNKLRRTTFPGDSVSIISTEGEMRNSNKTHRINGRWEYLIDSANSLLYTANLNIQDTYISTQDSGSTISEAIYKYVAATSSTIKKDDRNAVLYSGELLFRHKFTKPGRTFTLGWRNGKGNNEADQLNKAPVKTFFSDGSLARLIDINQNGLMETESANNTISSSYTEPIDSKTLFELNYAYAGSTNIADKKTFDFNTVSEKYDLVNVQQTNFFRYKNYSHRAGFNFRQQFKKYNYQLGIAAQVSNLENRSYLATSGKDTTVLQKFTNIFPSASFNYAITRSKSIRMMYRGRTNAPNAAQLQDVPDVSNPLQIKTGNPGLKQEFISNLNITFNSFALKSQRFFSASASLTFTGNKIVNSIDSAGMAVVIYKPENLGGSFNASGMITLSFPVKKIKGANVNLTNMSYFSRDPSLVYKKKYFTTMLQINQSAGISYGRDKWDMAISGGVVYNDVFYDLEQNSSNRYFNQAYSADFSFRFKNRFYLLTDFDYYIASGRSSGYNRDAFLWNISFAKKLMKTNAAEIKFTAYDLLKQNNGINRLVGENYYEDSRANVVPRFFLLSFNYNINRIGGKKPKAEPAPQMMIFK